MSEINPDEVPKIITSVTPSADIAIDIEELKELNESKIVKDEPTILKSVLETDDYYLAKLRAAVKDKIRKTGRSNVQNALAVGVKELTILQPSILTDSKNQNPKVFV